MILWESVQQPFCNQTCLLFNVGSLHYFCDNSGACSFRYLVNNKGKQIWTVKKNKVKKKQRNMRQTNVKISFMCHPAITRFCPQLQIYIYIFTPLRLPDSYTHTHTHTHTHTWNETETKKKDI